MPAPDPATHDDRRFVRHVLIAVALVGIAAALFSIIGLAWHATLTVFSGVLVGVLLDWIARAIARRTRLPRLLALALMGLVVVGGAVGFWWWVGSLLAREFAGISEQVTDAWARIQAFLERHAWGERVLEEIAELSDDGALTERIGGVLSTTVGSLGTVLLVVLFGVYFAISPDAYIDGTLRLLPEARRPRIRQVLGEIATALRSWLLGRVVSMAIVAAGTAIGLWIAGVPMALGLALIAGVLAFVPNIGPVLAGIPGVLVGLSQDPMTAVWAVVVYVVVQAIDNYAFTPFIDRRVVSLPPAFLLGFQLLLGLSAGLLGLFIATPLAVAIVVLVQALYIRDVLGDPVPIAGQNDATGELADPLTE